MERTANINLAAWRAKSATPGANRLLSTKLFAGILIACAGASALLATWVPLQFSIVTVFLFAGPHNWFELRYFLMRLPVRFGKSRPFFITAFAGIGLLTLAYLSFPLLNNFNLLPEQHWTTILAAWNTLLILWLAALVWLRGTNKPKRDWSWAFPVAFALCALNWMTPEFFSLALVYLHPLVALWFLDRHIARTRPEWQRTYRRCLCLLPLLLLGLVCQLARTPDLADDNGLFWRITQHAGAQMLPGVSSHFLVSVHVFLEMLHYGVWLLALPLIAPLLNGKQEKSVKRRERGAIWRVRSIPVANHPRGFPRLIAVGLAGGVFMVALLWFGFSVDYATTRDIYFTVAIAHVLAEAPFLLRML
ncbi:MAG TPA: hypothetical protein VLL54_03280 [Pyrinomonadaceae bacterium]|nr:hypothetical protein [Pyrinomonadaceae bacterium]